MNKYLLNLGILFASTMVNGQAFYTEIFSGWAFPFNQPDLYYSYEHLQQSNYNGPMIDKYTYRVVRGSLGTGLYNGVKFGYQFKSGIGAEIDLSYQKSRTIEATYVDNHYYASPYSTMVSYEDAILNWDSQMTRINPNITGTLGWGKTALHFKVGPVFGFGTITQSLEDYGYETYTYDDGFTSFFESNSYSYERTLVYRDGLALGINTSIGFEYKLNNHFSFLLNSRMMNLNYAPKSSKLTVFKVDGQDRLGELSVSQIQTEYLEEFEIDYSTPDPSATDKPSKDLKVWYPYSSLGVQFSVRFRF